MTWASTARWVIGTVGLLLVGFASAGAFVLATYDEGIELPLRNVSGLAVNSKGQIFCGLVRDGVVQEYGRRGEFLHSFKIPGDPSWFEIRINDKDNLEVADIGARKLYVFSDTGKMLENVRASESGGRYEEFAFDVARSTVDAQGAVLRVENGQLIRKLPDGRVEVIVKGRRCEMCRLRELAPLLYPAGIALVVIACLGLDKTISVVRRLASMRYPS